MEGILLLCWYSRGRRLRLTSGRTIGSWVLTMTLARVMPMAMAMASTLLNRAVGVLVFAEGSGFPMVAAVQGTEECLSVVDTGSKEKLFKMLVLQLSRAVLIQC